MCICLFVERDAACITGRRDEHDLAREYGYIQPLRSRDLRRSPGVMRELGDNRALPPKSLWNGKPAIFRPNPTRCSVDVDRRHHRTQRGMPRLTVGPLPERLSFVIAKNRSCLIFGISGAEFAVRLPLGCLGSTWSVRWRQSLP